MTALWTYQGWEKCLKEFSWYCVLWKPSVDHTSVSTFFVLFIYEAGKVEWKWVLSSVRKCELLWARLTVLEQNNIYASYTPPFWHCYRALFALLGMQLFFLPIFLILVFDLCVLAFKEHWEFYAPSSLTCDKPQFRPDDQF